jgi:NAD(P)-dependent dehydrogenase (short-subunit alcohol dehydrogenase family)
VNNQIAKTRQQDEHTPWAVTDLPPQTGKLAVVTGANSGIRWHTLRELARAGSEVIVAARSEAKGRDAVERVRRELPSAQVHFETLDLAHLPSVQAFASTG